MATFEVTDEFNGTFGSIAGHAPDTSTIAGLTWGLIGAGGNFSLAGGLAICQGGNMSAGDGGLALLAMPALTKYSAFVLEAVVATNAAPSGSYQTHNIDLSEIDNGGAGAGFQMLLLNVSGSVYTYNVIVRRLLNADHSGASQYVNLGIMDLTQTLALRIEATGSTFTAEINGVTVYADASVLDPARQTEGAARLSMFQQKNNTVGMLSFTGTIYEPPVLDTFHIRDDFDGARGTLLGRTPNIVDGVAPDLTWSDASESEWSGSMVDAETHGLILNGDGTARAKQRGA